MLLRQIVKVKDKIALTCTVSQNRRDLFSVNTVYLSYRLLKSS